MGRPVITFGRHNQYNFLPHVRVVTDETCLKKYLHDALEATTGQAERDGARFLRAVLGVSFDLGDYDYIHIERFDPKVVEVAAGSLIDSLPI